MRGGKFHRIVPDPAVPGNLTIETIPGTSGIRNSTGFDPTTNLVYGVGNTGGVRHVRAYDATGAIVFETPIQAPYPQDASQYAGTVLGDGRYIIHSVGNGSGTTGWYAGNRFNLWSIDPLTGASTHIGSTPVNFADFSYNPLDGYLYQIVNRVLWKVDPNDGSTSTVAMPGSFPNGSFGASWFDAAGNLYSFRNNPGDIFKVDPANPAGWTEVGEVGSDGGTDAGSCVSQIDLKKDVIEASGDPLAPDNRNFNGGNIARYKFTIINNGLPTQNRTVDLCDVLPADGREYSGVWTSTSPTATMTSGGAAGDTSFCLEVVAPSSLWTDPANPGQPPVEVVVEVRLTRAMAPGTYENQATLDFDQDGVVDVLSDDPGDGSDPRDPTTLSVMGAFLVDKTVIGHPTDDSTDSFAVTVACVLADGSPVDVLRTSFRNESTNAAWPGAATNTFSIRSGDVVRVRSLPAGATCEVTETANPSYETSTTSGDIAAGNVATLTLDEPYEEETVSFRNETSTFSITKTTDSTTALPVDGDGTFTFDVVCDDGTNATVDVTTTGGTGSASYPDVPLVPPGTECTITEQGLTGWSVTTANPQTVTTDLVVTPTAEFENVREFADLVVTKQIVGLPTSADPRAFVFDVSIECIGGGLTGTYSVPGPLTIATDSPITVADLPVGATCTVVEAPATGFNARFAPESAVEIATGGSTVEITNSTGSLIVEKNTVVPNTHPIDPHGTFTFDLQCVDSDGSTVFDQSIPLTTNSLTLTGATGGISHTEVGVLPPGAVCSITEQAPAAGWVIDSPATVSLDVTVDDPEPMATFTNRREVGSLTITKTLAGIPAGLNLDDETFTVDISCVGDFTSSPYVLTNQLVSVNTPLVIDDLPTNAVCTVSEDADDRFASTMSPPTGEITIDTDGETVALTNTTTSFQLTKLTSSANPAAADIDGTFEFAVECIAAGGDTLFDDTVSIATLLGTGSASPANLPLVPDGTTCTVNEVGPPSGFTLINRVGGTPVATNGIEVVTSATPAALEFENQLDAGTLTVTKDVTGVDVTTALEAEVFAVTVTCTGNFTGGTYTVPGPLTVTEGTPLVIDDLPVGSVCSASEADDARFTPTFTPAGGATIDAAGTATVAIDNATSTFAIDKTTTAPAGIDPDATFTFDVSCVDPDGATIFTDTVSITTAGGAGAWGLPDAPFVAPGTVCTVVEAPLASWAVSGSATTTITTTATTTETASFINERAVADLDITKTLIGIPDGFDLDGDLATDNDDTMFTVDVSCTGDFASSPLTITGLPLSVNAPLTVPNLPTGAVCEVTEVFDSRFQTLYSPDIGDGTAAVVSLSSAGASAGVTNSGGTLAVRKDTLAPSTHPIDLLVDVDYVIDCGVEYSGTHTLAVDQISGGQGIGGITYTELPIMPAGTVCSVTETVPTGWTVTTANPQSVTIGPNPPTASFVNERDTTSLTVTKVIDGLPAGYDLSDEEFIVDVSCSGGFTVDPYLIADQVITANTPLVIDDLPTGAVCSVIEDADERFATTIEPPVTLAAGGSELVVTNTTSSVAIDKTTVSSSPHPVALDGTFEFEITCPGIELVDAEITTVGQIGSWGAPNGPLVPPGTTCDVEETGSPDGWVDQDPDGIAITTDDSGIPVIASFTNVLATGSLTIAKTIIGSPAALADEPFTVDISCVGEFVSNPYLIVDQIVTVNTPLVIPDLPTGATCTVTEDPDARFLPAFDPDDGSAVITADGVEIGIDNRTGTFDITKEIVVAGTQPIDVTLDFAIDVSCTDGTSLSLTMEIVDGAAVTKTYPEIPLLPDGTACTISEAAAPAGWVLIEDADADTDTVANATEVVVSALESPTLTFVNERETGDLAIAKSVLGTPVGLDPSTLTFTVDVSCVGDFVSSPLEFTDQPIGDGGTIVIEDLPTGAVCQVVEDADARFAATYTPAAAIGSEVTIDTDGESVAIVNATGEVMIVKTTEASTAHPIDVTDTFTFDVECGAAYSGTHDVSATTVVTAASATGFLRYSDLPALPEGTVCSVTEAAAIGWTLSTPGPVGVTVDSAGVATASFTNTRDTGSLTVTKVLAGIPTGMNLDAELFDVEVSCTGGFTTSPYVVAGQISVNTPLVIDDLPTGAVCSVTETADPRFATTITAPVTIDADGESVAVTNTTSTIAISKLTDGAATNPLALDDTFTFTVDCGSLFSDDIDITTVTQAGTWQAPVTPLLAPGTDCEITEQAATGWTTTSVNPQIITSDALVTPTAAFTNTRDVGALTVTKVLAGVPTAVDLDAELFDVVVSCTGDFAVSPYEVAGQISVDVPLTVDDLPTGAICSVTETADPRFQTATSAAVVIDADGEELVVTNTTSTLSITKTTDGPADHPLSLDGTFTFDVVCGLLFAETVDISTTSQTGEWATPDTPLLPPGTDCEVTEQAAAGWAITTTNPQTITTDATSIVAAEFANTRTTGTLTIDKVLVGVPSGFDLTDDLFDITVECIGDFETSPYIVIGQVSATTPMVVENLPTGATCTVVEAPDGRFLSSYSPVGADSTTPVVIAVGDTPVTVTNTTGEIRIVKTTEIATTHPVDVTDTFTFDVDCGAAYSGTHDVSATTVLTAASATGFLRHEDLPLLPEGTVCTVAESAAVGWTLSTPGSVDIIVDSGGVATASFTNARDTGSLTVTKVLEGIPTGMNLDAELFDVEVSCTGDFTTSPYVVAGQISVDAPLVIDDLPTGAVCSVSETADPRFATEVGAPVTIDADGESVAVTNTTSTIAISKLTDGAATHPLALDDTFTFTVDCGSLFSAAVDITTVTQVGVWQAPDSPLLPPGTDCSVTEQASDGWTVTSANPQTITSDATVTTSALFTNTRDTGTLTINKVLAGMPASVDLDDTLFDVVVLCTGDFAASPYEVSGQISVNTPLVINDLPTGAGCSVSETPDPRFETTVDPAITIDTDGEELTVTNTTSTLSITKTTDGPADHPLSLDDTFTFDVVCGLLFAETVDISTTSQTGEWATPDTPLLPPGTDCEINEQPAVGWTVTSPNPQTVTTDAPEIVAAEFVNTRDTGTLIIEKVLVGVPAGIDFSDVLFNITVECTGDFEPNPHIVTGQVSANAPMVVENLPTDAACTVVETPDERFFTSYEPAGVNGATPVVVGTDGVGVVVTNTTGEILIVKETVAPTTHPVAATGRFIFTVDCGATYRADHEVVADVLTDTGAMGLLRYSDLPLLPDGTICTVSEQDPGPLWVLETTEPVLLTVSSDAPSTASFVNRRLTGDLNITKTLDGVPDDMDLSNELFEVAVSCSGGFTEDPYVTIHNVTASTPIALTDLPTTSVCSVVETADSRFATSYSTESVTIGDVPATVDITNATGVYEVIVNTAVDAAHPIELDDTFEIEISCSYTDADGNPATYIEIVTITTVDGQGSYRSPLLPANTICTTIQLGDSSWSLDNRAGGTNTNENGIDYTVVGGSNTLEFFNSRAVTSLEVTKTLANVPESADHTATEFEVTVVCEGGFTIDSYEVPGDLVISTLESLVIDGLPVGTECAVTEAAHEFFDATYDVDGAVTLDESGAMVSITNTGNEALNAAPTLLTPLALTGAELSLYLFLAFTLLASGVTALFVVRRRTR